MAKVYYKNTVKTVVTIVAALLAATAVFFLIWKLASPKSVEEVPIEVYQPTQELAAEMKKSATSLLKANHEVLSLFYTKGISSKEEPYGAAPDDGFYTGADEIYTTYAQVEELVRDTFIKSIADDILTNPLGNGPTLGDDGDGALGISASFVPMQYDRSWESVSFGVTPISDKECSIELTLKDGDGKDVAIKAKMTKQDGKWLLEDIVY